MVTFWWLGKRTIKGRRTGRKTRQSKTGRFERIQRWSQQPLTWQAVGFQQGKPKRWDAWQRNRFIWKGKNFYVLIFSPLSQETPFLQLTTLSPPTTKVTRQPTKTTIAWRLPMRRWVGRSWCSIKDIDTFTFSKASLKEEDPQDKKDPVRDWMCSIKIEWLCQAGIN